MLRAPTLDYMEQHARFMNIKVSPKNTQVTEHVSLMKQLNRKRTPMNMKKESQIRSQLCDILDQSREEYSKAVASKRQKTLVPVFCRTHIFKFWSRLELITTSHIENGSEVHGAHLVFMFAALLEARNCMLTLFAHGKNHANAKAIFGQLKFLLDTIKRLEQCVDSSLYSYGNRRASHSTPLKPKFFGGRRASAPSRLQDQENQSANKEAKEEASSHIDAVCDLMTKSCLRYFEEAMGMVGAKEKELLFKQFPELQKLKQSVATFANQHYAELVVLMYLAETTGKAAVAVLRTTNLRHSFGSLLQTAFSMARAAAWTVLANEFGVDLNYAQEPTQEDLSTMLLV